MIYDHYDSDYYDAGCHYHHPSYLIITIHQNRWSVIVQHLKSLFAPERASGCLLPLILKTWDQGWSRQGMFILVSAWLHWNNIESVFIQSQFISCNFIQYDIMIYNAISHSQKKNAHHSRSGSGYRKNWRQNSGYSWMCIQRKYGIRTRPTILWVCLCVWRRPQLPFAAETTL